MQHSVITAAEHLNYHLLACCNYISHLKIFDDEVLKEARI